MNLLDAVTDITEHELTALSLENLLTEQAKDPFCEIMGGTSLYDPKVAITMRTRISY